MKNYDIVVIGGGPAGMAAAVSAYDSGVRDIAVLERDDRLGGILNQCIHAGFGLHSFGEEMTGPEYAYAYETMVKNRNISLYFDTTVMSVSRDKVITACNSTGVLKIQAKAVILAMGCRERSRGALNIGGTRPAGIFTAGTAQKLMNCDGCMVGKQVVILGSGDIGLIMARRLTLEGSKVLAVCELQPFPGGLTRNIVQCLDDFHIPLYLQTTVAEIHGRKRVEGVTLVQVDTNRKPVSGTERYIACDTLLLSVGLIPENELTREAGIELDPATGGATVDEAGQTDSEGIFACGNVLQVHDLVDYVSQESSRAGENAANYVLQRLQQKPGFPIRAGAGIRYIVPQKFHPGKSCALSFRVSRPCGPVEYVVKSDSKTLLRKKVSRAVPGEMVMLELSAMDTQKAESGLCVLMEERL